MNSENLFEAKAESLSRTMGSYAGKVGFKVPEYQRTYDWKEENINRLLEDCLIGFDNCWQSSSSYTFLGTIILVKEQRSQERTFDGTSLEVVDGQQRLTTLGLLCCVLIEMLIAHKKDSQSLKEPTKQWIDDEVDFHLDTLFECLVGQLPERGTNHPFPRIVRSVDNRASNARDAEYRSVVSRFLMDFADYYMSGNSESSFEPNRDDSTAEGRRLLEKYDYVKEQMSLALERVNDDGFALDFERTGRAIFERRSVRRLFEKLHLMGEAEENKAVAEISQTGTVAVMGRLVTFSSYVTKCVILTRVETDNDSYAFDIFDALNTTGEPLTALETLAPRIIQFESSKEGFEGSESQRHLQNLREHLDEVFIQTELRQKATKELLVSFALYREGYKLGMQLNAQRTYLRNGFQGFGIDEEGTDLRRRFLKSISDVAEFRCQYWYPDQIRTLDAHHSPNVSDTLKLCFSLISNMNTSLALPILARYWEQWQRDEAKEVAFVEAVKAICAFIVLRRTVTGGTAGIDSELRRMMRERPSIGGEPLCVGAKHSNPLIGTEELKKELRERYLKQPWDASNKDAWVEMANEMPLAPHSRPLCRFLLLAASHNAMPDKSHPGLLTRRGVVPSEDLHFLKYETWERPSYATMEHVAPDVDTGGNWDTKIYSDANTKHSIGNLILLPQRENSTIGNVGWAKKQLFYSALTAKTVEEKEKAVRKARENGLSFGRKTEGLLQAGERLRMLDSLTRVVTWDRQLIKSRGKRTLELAWEEVWKWLSRNSD